MTEGGVGAVRRLEPSGTLTTIGGYPFAGLRHGNEGDRGPSSLMGLTVDSGGRIYVADYDHRLVYVVEPSGVVSVFLSSGLIWSPRGVAVGRDGLYVLEHPRGVLDLMSTLGVGARVRVRRVGADGGGVVIASVGGRLSASGMLVLLSLVVLVGGLAVFARRRHRRVLAAGHSHTSALRPSTASPPDYRPFRILDYIFGDSVPRIVILQPR